MQRRIINIMNIIDNYVDKYLNNLFNEEKETLEPTEKGQEPITFQKGGLHKSLHVPQDEKIPTSKFKSALKGEYGKKAKKQAQFKKNVLTGPED
jgi:hypothetical protein